MEKEINNKINFFDKITKEFKQFDTLQQMSDYIEELAFNRYNKDFMRARNKDVYFKVINKSNKYKTINYKVTFLKNKRVVGIVKIPMEKYKSPTKDFMIRIEKSKYKEKE